MDKFEVGDQVIVIGPPGNECIGEEAVIKTKAYFLGGEMVHDIRFDAQHFGRWNPIYLKKKQFPESKDIRDTREKGAPSFDKMMDDLMRKPVRVEE